MHRSRPRRWLLGLAALAVGVLALEFARRSSRVTGRPISIEVGAESDERANAADVLSDARETGAADESAAPLETERALVDASSAPPPAQHELQLLDAATREPLPSYAVRVTAGESAWELESDARGAVELPPLPLTGFVLLELVEMQRSVDDGACREPGTNERRDVVLLRGERGGELPSEVLVPVGPTYRLDLALPRGTAPEVFAVRLEPDGASRDSRRCVAALRAGSPSWVRFSPKALRLDPRERWSLSLVSGDLMWRAESEVAPARGVAPGVVRIAFERRARLLGCVRDRDGGAFAAVEVEATCDRGSSRVATRSFSNGEFVLGGLVPGRIVLRSRLEGRQDFEMELHLAAGESRRVEVEFSPASPIHSRAVLALFSFSESPLRGTVCLSLQSLERPGEPPRVRSFTLDAESAAEARFSAVEAGRYRLRVVEPDSDEFWSVGLRIEPSEVEFSTEDPPPRFVVREN